MARRNTTTATASTVPELLAVKKAVQDKAGSVADRADNIFVAAFDHCKVNGKRLATKSKSLAEVSRFNGSAGLFPEERMAVPGPSGIIETTLIGFYRMAAELAGLDVRTGEAFPALTQVRCCANGLLEAGKGRGRGKLFAVDADGTPAATGSNPLSGL